MIQGRRFLTDRLPQFYIMLEFLNNYSNIIVLYSPLGAIGIWRWSIWIFKKITAWRYKPIKNNSYKTTLSVITPVYNEKPRLFREALKSWQQNNPEEIIAVIDHSDKVCIKEFQDFAKIFGNTKLVITDRPGKRPALSDGIKAAIGEIVALVDSDTIWDKNIREDVLAPFSDSLVGGVGTRQNVLKTDTLARRLFNIHLDHRYFDEMPFLAKSGNALTCLSGRTALYRRKAIIDLVDKMVNETFWHKQCISGEDKCLTRLVQASGWKTRYQMNVCVRTSGMPDLLTFFKQQTRWIRNSWRSDIKSLSSKWIWRREKILAFYMIDRFTQPFTLILGPIYFVLSIIWNQYLIAAILLTWWHFSRAIKIYSHLKHRPSDLFILPAYVLTTYIIAIIKIYDLFTINKQGWITRWNKDRLKDWKYLKLAPAYLGTAMVILFLGFGVINYKQTSVIFKPNMKVNNDIKFSEIESTITDDHNQKVLNNLENQQSRYYLYTIEQNDILSVVAQKYNSKLFTIIEANKDILPNPDYLKTGQQIKIPVLELGDVLKKNELVFFKEPDITFDESNKTIYVEGRGSVVTFPKIHNALNHKSILEKLNNKEWLLKTNLLVRKGVILVIDDSDVSWLKLKSGKDGFVWLQSNGGNISIKNTKITSWDEENQTPDTNYEDGRSFILARQNGRMDIINSELSFLGYENSLKSGVAWHTTGNSPNNYLITGQVLDSKFYNNHSGIYLSGTTRMMVSNNKIAHNAQYGINIRNGANNLLIKNNHLRNNGDYGIVIPKQFFNNDIADNFYYNNRTDQVVNGRW